jgi:hypothetical protein
MSKVSIKTLKEIENQLGEFEVGQVFGIGGDVYLKFGYWKQVNLELLQKILGDGVKVDEDMDYDDDCGEQYSYKLLFFL